MGGHRDRDGSQQPQQGTVEREAMTPCCLASGWGWKKRCHGGGIRLGTHKSGHISCQL